MWQDITFIYYNIPTVIAFQRIKELEIIMTIDEKYMRRCFQLATNGRGFVSPNPMVGSVVVYKDTIIGEGYHRSYGRAHAEVNAINSVKDQSLLKESTLYVSLEPCSHYGKTPPCAQLIIDKQIPRVVIATLDPYPQVSGRGVKMLQDAGVEVVVGLLESKARKLNKEFFTTQTKGRPYIYLKWAQTSDGFIDKVRIEGEAPQPTPISDDFSKMLVHKLRTEIPAIMIGTNTAMNDNPFLTARLWSGKSPVRVVLDRERRIPADYNLFDGTIETLVYTENVEKEEQQKGVRFVPMPFDSDILSSIMADLQKRRINAVMVEGGLMLLQSLIDKRLWDEAFVEIANVKFEKGVLAPTIKGEILDEWNWGKSRHLHLASSPI